MANIETNLVWLDMELSGLDIGRHVILEVATVITSPQLEILQEVPVQIIHYADSVLESMDDWNKQHHQQSGLWADVQNSQLTVAQAEMHILDAVKEHVACGSSPLCGNSMVLDRIFLRKFMPQLHEYLHYHNIDVTSIKEVAQRWYPHVPVYEGNEVHRAMDDVLESISELKYYRTQVFLPGR
jgi:oligoribonuclease